MSRIAIACLAAALTVATSFAQAQPPAPDASRANALGHEALEAYRKNDWATAYQRFADAEAAAHSPVFVLYMARCKRNAGDLLAARDILARAAGEVLPDTATPPWKTARADAGRELGEIESRIPSFVIAIRGGSSDAPPVTVDGAPISADALRAPIRMNPGPHTIQVMPPGRAPIKAEVRLVEGDPPQKVEIVIPADPPKVEPRVAPVATAPATPPPAPPARGSIVPGVIGISLGAAGLIAGAIVGGVAKSKGAEATKPCTTLGSGGLDCPQSVKSDVEHAEALATGSTVAFIAGGALAAAGIVLVIVRPGGGKQASAQIAPGPGSITFRATF